MQTVAFDTKDLNVLGVCCWWELGPGLHDCQGLLSSLWPEVFKNWPESCGISLVSRFEVQKVSSRNAIPADDTRERAGVLRVAKVGRGGPWLGLD